MSPLKSALAFHGKRAGKRERKLHHNWPPVAIVVTVVTLATSRAATTEHAQRRLAELALSERAIQGDLATAACTIAIAIAGGPTTTQPIGQERADLEKQLAFCLCSLRRLFPVIPTNTTTINAIASAFA